jgi:hypothetical protein
MFNRQPTHRHAVRQVPDRRLRLRRRAGRGAQVPGIPKAQDWEEDKVRQKNLWVSSGSGSLPSE